MEQFEDVREFLSNIHDMLGEGYLVALSWDGLLLRASIARPASGKRQWVMTFDGDEDFSTESQELIDTFVSSALKHFGG